MIRTDSQKDRWSKDGQPEGRTIRRTNNQDEWSEGPLVKGRMVRRTDGQKDGWSKGRMF